MTTRHCLPLQNQLAYPLEGLGVPPAAVANERSVTHLLAQYAGVQLFVERAESTGLPLPLDQATVAAVGALHLEMGENAVAGDYCERAFASPAAQTLPSNGKRC